MPASAPAPATPPPLTWAMRLRMTRPGFLLLTVAACLLGLAWASAVPTGGALQPLTALATVLLAVVAHAGANVLNDYHDARNGADAANRQGLFPFSGGSRMIQQGLVSVRTTGRWAAVLLWCLVLSGIGPALSGGCGLPRLGPIALRLAWGYSAPPLALMARGLGELAVGAAWWLVVLGTYYVQRGQWQLEPAFSTLGFGLLVVNLLLINGVPDAPADASVGKRTLVVRRAAWLYLALALLAHAWLGLSVLLQLAPARALWGVVTLPLALGAAMLLLRHAEQAQRLRPAIGLTILSAIGHALAQGAGLVWG